MSKGDTYAQCSMERKVSTGVQQHVAWIPNEFAVVGKYIRIKFEETWIDGWLVTGVGAKKDWLYLELKSRDHLRQRKASDI